ncbi:hypothetical protein AAFC00_000122 [Neodothiora populina]
MPLRERLRRVFGGSSDGSDRKTSSQNSEKSAREERWPSNVYAPGEPMPRPKYRAPVKKEHKEKLESFNWGTAWRRQSFISEYSPMGSRMPSRRNSLISRKSFGGKSSRRNSIGDSGKEVEGVQTKSRHAARATRLSAEIEAEGDDDVTNVGLSRVQSRDKDKALSRQLSLDHPLPTSGARNIAEAAAGKSSDGVAQNDQPFTEEELALALKKSHLTVPDNK